MYLNCRMCNSKNLFMFLDLGFTPPADQFRRKEQLKDEDIYYPLQACACEDCGLVQLNHVVSHEILYRNDYPYESSTTKMGHDHWSKFADTVVKRFNLSESDLVVDIGSNVGVLLSAFKDCGVQIQGVDPAANIVMIAKERGIDTLCDFFNTGTVDKIISDKGKATVITATNVFAHVDDLQLFMENILELLNDRGVFIFEAPYLVNLFNNNEYDTIYHEHLSYLSVKPLLPFFAKFGMEVIDIKQVDIHGGSFRVFVSTKGNYDVAACVSELVSKEESSGIYRHEYLLKYSERVKKNKENLTWLLHSLKHEGEKIVGVSAPAKGMTLLNYCKIDSHLLDFITEKSALKIGRYTPGAHIPVLPDSALLDHQPEYALLLAWNFADEIIKNLDEYRKRGGKFIIPIPTPTII